MVAETSEDGRWGRKVLLNTSISVSRWTCSLGLVSLSSGSNMIPSFSWNFTWMWRYWKRCQRLKNNNGNWERVLKISEYLCYEDVAVVRIKCFCFKFADRIKNDLSKWCDCLTKWCESFSKVKVLNKKKLQF